MGQLLDLNIRLADLQKKFSSIFEATGEKKRFLDNMEEHKIEKRLKII